MKTLACLPVVTALLLAPIIQASEPAPSVIVDRADDTGFVRVEVKSFSSLNARQQQLAYWLTQAAIATDPIVYDQFFAFSEYARSGCSKASSPIQRPRSTRRSGLSPSCFWANRGKPQRDHFTEVFCPPSASRTWAQPHTRRRPPAHLLLPMAICTPCRTPQPWIGSSYNCARHSSTHNSSRC